MVSVEEYLGRDESFITEAYVKRLNFEFESAIIQERIDNLDKLEHLLKDLKTKAGVYFVKEILSDFAVPSYTLSLTKQCPSADCPGRLDLIVKYVLDGSERIIKQEVFGVCREELRLYEVCSLPLIIGGFDDFPKLKNDFRIRLMQALGEEQVII